MDRNAPLKTKVIRGNQAPFINKELAKNIMTRSRPKNNFVRHKTKSNWIAYKKQGNKCIELRNKSIKNYFSKKTEKGIRSNKAFWKTIRPFLSNKGTHDKHEIMLQENGSLIKEKEKVSETLNDFYVNIVEHTTGMSAQTYDYSNCCTTDKKIDKIIDNFREHPSILKIKEKHQDPKRFTMSLAQKGNIFKLLKSLDSSKGPGYDTLSAKLIKMADPLLTEPLTDITNSSIINETYPDTLKITTVCPAYKKEDRLDKKNYRPISILNTFTKIFERFYLTKLTPIFDKIMSENLSAFRKNYSTQHVLLRLTEQWRSFLDDNKYVGAVLMDLSKAFDCLPHDLLIAKLSAYGLDKKVLKLFYSYLSNRKQSVRIQGYQSLLRLIISGVPQGSILAPILFNLFMNDLYYFINAENLHNFADDNTLTDQAGSLIALI